MLFTIIDTKPYGKFVLHCYPYASIIPPKEDITAVQLSENIMNSFEYFGIYEKNKIIATSNGYLNEKTVVDLFSANQKYTELVMGIDENCVLVSKSSFLDGIRQYFQNIEYPTNNVELGEFESMNDSQSSIINSISLVYRSKTFDELEKIKHKLSFLIGALQTREKHQRYLSRQITKIMQEKVQLKKVLKEKCSFNNNVALKDNTNQIIDEFKIKMIYKEIQTEVDRLIKNISLFELLQNLQHSWEKHVPFKSQVKEDEFLECINGSDLIIPEKCPSRSAQGRSGSLNNPAFVRSASGMNYSSKQQELKQIQHKTLITVPLKLCSLPTAIYPNERIDYIYERLLINNNKPLKRLLQHESNKESIIHTIDFLIQNRFATAVYPLDPERFYCLYTLRALPDKKTIQKYQYLFGGQSGGSGSPYMQNGSSKGLNEQSNIFEYLVKFQKYHRIKQLDEKTIYLILHRVLKEVLIYVERLENASENSEVMHHGENVSGVKKVGMSSAVMLKQSSSGRAGVHQNELIQRQKRNAEIANILGKYVMKRVDINLILSQEPKLKMIELITFVKHNSNDWKFIFVEGQ